MEQLNGVCARHNTTETVSNAKPIEMQCTNLYEESVIKALCKELGLKSIMVVVVQ